MLTRRERKIFHILEIIQTSEIPVGANFIRNQLAALDIIISEATAGRLLIELDKQGLTIRDGYKGRILTELGKNQLKEMQLRHDRMEYGEEFFKILDGKSEKELVDVLIARRAIEREIARLAAENLTPDIQSQMVQMIMQQKMLTNTQNTSHHDALFHELIAKAAGNRVLETMLHMIRRDAQLIPALEYIRKQVNSSIAVDHVKILEAIINRDPEGAESAMLEHIENLIRDVNKFWMKKG